MAVSGAGTASENDRSDASDRGSRSDAAGRSHAGLAEASERARNAAQNDNTRREMAEQIGRSGVARDLANQIGTDTAANQNAAPAVDPAAPMLTGTGTTSLADTVVQSLREEFARRTGQAHGQAQAAYGFTADMVGGAVEVAETVVDAATLGIENTTGIIDDNYAAKQQAQMDAKVEAVADAYDYVTETPTAEIAQDIAETAQAVAEKYAAEFAYADKLEHAYHAGTADISALHEASRVRAKAETELSIMGLEAAATVVGIGAAIKGLRAAKTLNKLDGPSLRAIAHTDLAEVKARSAALDDLIAENPAKVSVQQIEQRVVTRLPRTNGTWEGVPGESKWYPDNPDAKSVIGNDGVTFKDGRPDFSPWSKGEISFPDGALDGSQRDFAAVYEAIAEQKNLRSANAAKTLLKERGLTPHHFDTNTIQLIPTDLHGNIPHVGSASDMRRLRGE